MLLRLAHLLMPSRGLLLGSFDSWRVLFLVGLATGAYIAAGITPAAFDVLPASFTVIITCSCCSIYEGLKATCRSKSAVSLYSATKQ